MNQICDQRHTKGLQQPGEITLNICVQSQSGSLKFQISIDYYTPFNICFEYIKDQVQNCPSYFDGTITIVINIPSSNGDQSISASDTRSLKDIGLVNQSEIQVILKLKGGGSPFAALDFSNMKNMKLVTPGSYGPDWRTVKSGLNMPGICQNEKCEAANKEVICPQGNGTFYMAEIIQNLCCPQCKSKENVIAGGDCVFWDCIYSYRGAFQNKGDTQSTKVEKLDQRCPKGEAAYFMGTKEEDRTKWLYLIITTQKL